MATSGEDITRAALIREKERIREEVSSLLEEEKMIEGNESKVAEMMNILINEFGVGTIIRVNDAAVQLERYIDLSELIGFDNTGNSINDIRTYSLNELTSGLLGLNYDTLEILSEWMMLGFDPAIREETAEIKLRKDRRAARELHEMVRRGG